MTAEEVMLTTKDAYYKAKELLEGYITDLSKQIDEAEALLPTLKPHHVTALLEVQIRKARNQVEQYRQMVAEVQKSIDDVERSMAS